MRVVLCRFPAGSIASVQSRLCSLPCSHPAVSELALASTRAFATQASAQQLKLQAVASRKGVHSPEDYVLAKENSQVYSIPLTSQVFRANASANKVSPSEDHANHEDAYVEAHYQTEQELAMSQYSGQDSRQGGGQQQQGGGQRNGPTRPPQARRQQPSQSANNHGGDASMSDAQGGQQSQTPRKRHNEPYNGQDSEERPAHIARQEGGQGGRGGRGGMRGGRGGGQGGGRGGAQQGQNQGQGQFTNSIPHPGQQQQQQQQGGQFNQIMQQQAAQQQNQHQNQQQQQQQQRPQTAQPQGQRQQGQGQGQGQNGGGRRGGRGGGGNQNGGGGRGGQGQRHVLEGNDADMADAPEHGASMAGGASASSSGAVRSSGAASRAGSGAVDASFKTTERFDGLGLSAPTARAMKEEFGYETMSLVQSKTIAPALTGRDLVAKAKTGTGKTLAFLIPLVEKVVAGKRNLPPSQAPRPIRALVISPTRELAQQIEEEALRLGKFHGISLACLVGGLDIKKDLRVLQGGHGLDLVIATPGRLKDLLQNHQGIKPSFQALCFLVLDEADRLLDMGFKPDLDAIFALLPRAEARQTLLFSATFPPNVQDMTDRTLRRDHIVVNTVGDEEDQTHKHVTQESIIVPLAQQYEALWDILQQHKQATPHYKVIVFFTTARVASFSSRLFNQADMPTLELHSRLSQSKRTKTSDTFREGQKMILFSSDVSARGLDFPGVTLIVQLGLTQADQYVHRLGRTARAGNEGHGIIILAPFERNFLNTLTRGKDALPIKPMNVAPGTPLAQLVAGQAPAYPAQYRKGQYAHPVHYALASVESSGNSGSEDSLKVEAESAYRAWLGFYNGNLRTCGFNQTDLVQTANEWAGFIGLAEVPTIEAKTVGKMGLRGVPGLRVVPSNQRQGGGGGRGGGGGGRGGGQQGGGGGRGGYGGGRPQSARY